MKPRLRRLRDRIGKRTGLYWGAFRTPDNAKADHRFVVRVGWGEGRRLVNVEAGTAGRTLYLNRAKTD